jgi:hypothetical protein
MATLTANILVGKSHTYDGGIQPTHQLFLSENSMPAWILMPNNLLSIPSPDDISEKVIWHPTLENMLEDALLMIALYVLRDADVQSAARQYFQWNNESRVEVYRIDPEHRIMLYAMCRKLTQRYKVVVSVFLGSSIAKHLSMLKEYDMEAEICKSGGGNYVQ